MGHVETGMAFNPPDDLSLGITRVLIDVPVQFIYASFGLTWRFK